jgi:hypothetical protein
LLLGVKGLIRSFFLFWAILAPFGCFVFFTALFLFTAQHQAGQNNGEKALRKSNHL